ncbi:hypothetical protein CYMTET_24889 [Cymbomonas tetramitiformis]|uniref:Uncharacterized protein n=1 Tax=Cymbomonas tetramitiformis TaxID=36881 RepID=A0AAE0FUX7_9CHLO|nr:hypothetical protein CYMTET_24889 [Cymbomonas tetramitiformis]
MASPPQRARMAAIQAAVKLLRRRHFAAGYNLVVPGGASAPHAKIHSDVSAINGIDYFDSSEFVSPHFPLPPGAFLGRRLVVSGGVDTPYILGKSEDV